MNKSAQVSILLSAATAAFLTAGQAFAVEPGDFQATLRGATIGIPLGAAPPPGLYAGLETFIGINNPGVGQNSAAAGANGGRGITVFGEAIIPSLVWATPWNLWGGNLTFAVIQPFFTVAGLNTTCAPVGGLCPGSPPIAFGNGSFFENVHNTVWTSSLSWNWHNGWFTSFGLGLQGPDGSQYAGTLNQDYWTVSPTFAVAYLDKTWELALNMDYDIHTASAGHTGTYAALANNVPGLPALVAPNGCVGFACPGNGYTTGNQLFIDWSAKYKTGRWAFGPVGYFKFQTTADTPGSGYTCAQLSANHAYGPSLSCGRATDIALGANLSYNLGPANIELYATDSVYTQDDFKGWSVFTRLSFKLWGPEPAAAPLITKAH